MEIKKGQLLAEGKTKRVFEVQGEPAAAILEAKDDITAGDGAKHDIIAGKAELATATTCNVFDLLMQCDIPLAYRGRVDERSFLAELCDMHPFEVVVRREAHGSYLKRAPHLPKGTLFPRLLVEFYLKTSGCVWNGQPIPKDDPLMTFDDSGAHLWRPDLPLHVQGKPFLTLDDDFFRSMPQSTGLVMSNIARKTFLVLEKAWQLLGRRLVDMKVEFGRSLGTRVTLADVISNDEWRVLEDGAYIDKQAYRDGGDIDDVLARYRKVARLTESFGLPRQRIVLWRGSPSDSLDPFMQVLTEFYFGTSDLDIVKVTRSMHKEPVAGTLELQRLVQEVPDTVVIAFVGRSNGAGPTLSAAVTAPVITVPAGYRDFPEDAWSSLRAPSATPVMTVLEPKNAALAALQILAARNPRLYSKLRFRQEERLTNVVPLF